MLFAVMISLCVAALLPSIQSFSSNSFENHGVVSSESCAFGTTTFKPRKAARVPTGLWSMSMDDAPSDYDTADLLPEEQAVTVDTNGDDVAIRDALKRELLLLASVTNRGEFATQEEKDIVVDIVTQLEALNPTANPASNCKGEWDLFLASTQSFRSSPFFLFIRAVLGDENKAIAKNGFDIHDRATSASRVARVRQTVSDDKIVSEVDLEVGFVPGLPVRIKGTVVTSADLDVLAPETWELGLRGTRVRGSNVPFVNEFLDNLDFEFPFGEIYNTVTGSAPLIQLKTFYVDEGIRITRDVDNNFFVFSRN